MYLFQFFKTTSADTFQTRYRNTFFLWQHSMIIKYLLNIWYIQCHFTNIWRQFPCNPTYHYVSTFTTQYTCTFVCWYSSEQENTGSYQAPANIASMNNTYNMYTHHTNERPHNCRGHKNPNTDLNTPRKYINILR